MQKEHAPIGTEELGGFNVSACFDSDILYEFGQIIACFCASVTQDIIFVYLYKWLSKLRMKSINFYFLPPHLSEFPMSATWHNAWCVMHIMHFLGICKEILLQYNVIIFVELWFYSTVYNKTCSETIHLFVNILAQIPFRYIGEF